MRRAVYQTILRLESRLTRLSVDLAGAAVTPHDAAEHMAEIAADFRKLRLDVVSSLSTFQRNTHSGAKDNA
jgi:hypothetical protein